MGCNLLHQILLVIMIRFAGKQIVNFDGGERAVEEIKSCRNVTGNGLIIDYMRRDSNVADGFLENLVKPPMLNTLLYLG